MQGALSVVLLVGAALFVRSLATCSTFRSGYDVSTVIDVYPDFRGLERDSATRVAMNRRLLAAAQAIPGVEAAARVNSRLFGTNTTDAARARHRLGRGARAIQLPDLDAPTTSR